MKSLVAPLALLLSALHTCVVAQYESANHLPPLLSGPIREPNQTLITIFGVNGSAPGTMRSPTPIRSPGQLVQKQEVSEAPLLGIPVVPNNGSQYALVMVDPNYNNSVPTSTVLHYLVHDIAVQNASIIYAGLRGFALTHGNELAPYLAPQAPSAAMPHNYTLMLFRQPSGFAVPEKFKSYMAAGGDNRRNFPVLDFLDASGLGKSPIAAVYFREGGAGNMTIPTYGNSTMGNSTSGNSTAGSAKPTASFGFAGSSNSSNSSMTFSHSPPTPTASPGYGSPSGSSSGSKPSSSGGAANGASMLVTGAGATAMVTFMGLLSGALFLL